MCSRDLPDMYALSPRACGPWASGIHIRQIPRAHVTTITYNIVVCVKSNKVCEFINTQNYILVSKISSYPSIIGT